GAESKRAAPRHALLAVGCSLCVWVPLAGPGRAPLLVRLLAPPAAVRRFPDARDRRPAPVILPRKEQAACRHRFRRSNRPAFAGRSPVCSPTHGRPGRTLPGGRVLFLGGSADRCLAFSQASVVPG